jgi:hypothetical protein
MLDRPAKVMQLFERKLVSLVLPVPTGNLA